VIVNRAASRRSASARETPAKSHPTA
jgi:hypothetical protein